MNTVWSPLKRDSKSMIGRDGIFAPLLGEKCSQTAMPKQPQAD